MPERWPVIITDDDGDEIGISPLMGGAGYVLIWAAPDGVALDAAQRDEFARALVTASHEADQQAVSGDG
jgi:hypothetical protein